MFRHVKYTDAERRLASLARKKAMNRDVLYHGTRYGRLILGTGVLFRAEIGDKKVCLTRSAEVAAYWAMVRRGDDEGRGSIFILDRQSLERRYKIKAVPEVYFCTKTLFHDEAEEEIWDNVTNIEGHLIGVVSGPKTLRSNEHKRLNREYQMEIQARLRQLGDHDGLLEVTKIYHALRRFRRDAQIVKASGKRLRLLAGAR